MLVLAIDGACRRNGKPDCVSAGGVFVEHYDNALRLLKTQTLGNYEMRSTNQRGELIALLTALNFAWFSKEEAIIVTDSEYIFNVMTKEWVNSWNKKGWVTSTLTPVKNKDLWQKIQSVYAKCLKAEIDINIYHIKGHVIPFGKVTASNLLSKDDSGLTLYTEVLMKYDSVAKTSRLEVLTAANNLSYKNNGFRLEDSKLRHFVCINVMADAIATRCVNAADALVD